MTPPEIVGRLLCLLGHHDWFVKRSEARYKIDDGPDGCLMFGQIALFFLTVIHVLWVFISIMLYRPTVISITEYTIGFISLSVCLVLWWAISFYYRNEKRIDGQCYRCNKLRLDVTKRRRAVDRTKTFFKELTDIEDEK